MDFGGTSRRGVVGGAALGLPGPFWTPLQVAGGQLPGKTGEFGQDSPLGRAGLTHQ